MVISDQGTRDRILDEDLKNIVVSASAGCGKTTILVDKLIRICNVIRNHQTIAAITFTIKATEELKDRTYKANLNKDLTICTNDSFVENEILRPFILDVLGEEFSQDFVVDFNKKFNFSKEGIKLLKADKILGSYYDNKKNFKFKLGLSILKNSVAAQQFLISKYRMLFLDEYQDSDQDMHSLFMYIKDELKIPLFIVGDSKQAIYLWRGAKENIFEEFDDSFTKYELYHNFRSHFNITNFANLLHKENYLESKASEIINEIALFSTNKGFSSAVIEILQKKEVNLDKKITIIINVNSAAEECRDFLNSNGYQFEFIPRTPIDDGIINTFVLRCLMKLIVNKYYSIYDFLLDLNLEVNTSEIKTLEKQVGLLTQKLEFQNVEVTLNKIAEIINVNFSDNEIRKFLQTLENDSYNISFLDVESKHKIMTVFATKGLEFDQVIIRASDYPLDSIGSLNNHYVALTRAKEKVVIVDNTNIYKKNILGRLKNKNIHTIDQVLKTL
ncbi:UvrD-helicase domain-containing protein [Bacillus sp. J37]|uniref:UvrD-helicase domain-containing protein n=1 Tax=Bacillus sp. J37 TaxID=935837 RepID=UPI0004BBB9C8|nr:UvrD-helicase domain-containing protein [Bacillus sp. J37]